MKKSCHIAAMSHKEVISNVKVGMSEFDIESMYLNQFRIRGSRYPSYTPIVAGGKNACILHYIDNNQSIEDGDLVLVDAGCEYGMYAFLRVYKEHFLLMENILVSRGLSMMLY